MKSSATELKGRRMAIIALSAITPLHRPEIRLSAVSPLPFGQRRGGRYDKPPDELSEVRPESSTAVLQMRRRHIGIRAEFYQSLPSCLRLSSSMHTIATAASRHIPYAAAEMDKYFTNPHHSI